MTEVEVPKVPAYKVLADALRKQILSGELRTGVRLPNESELSAQYGVGRSTVREALRVLSSQNLIETTRGVTGGSFVAVPEPEDISAHLEIGLALLTLVEEISVEQLLEVRQLLEVPAAGNAAQRRTNEQLEQLRSAALAPRGKSGDVAYPQNQEFHLILLRCSGNPLLEVVTAPVFRVLETRFGRDRGPASFWRRVDEDHQRLLTLVEAGDAVATMQAMREHLSHLRDAYLQMDRRRRR
ncbi:FadR/GntR family transcriptional regulator [Micromonospora sonneratiae]|uniref:FadR/GntR family transcriptional regulator n=1 Tax=Micromonospora sonneratiae TaxID=1184706 RepID=A0ABW3Y5L6_9ACTN